MRSVRSGLALVLAAAIPGQTGVLDRLVGRAEREHGARTGILVVAADTGRVL